MGTIGRKFASVLGSLVLHVAFTSVVHAAPGDLDLSFGSGGKVTTTFPVVPATAASYAVAIQADGKIVAVGPAGAFNTQVFALARYNVDGSLDSTFGTAGLVTTDFVNGPESALAVVIQADGKIVATGDACTIIVGANCNDFALARYNADGSLDSTFGSGGKVTTDFGRNEAAAGVAIQADGKIVAAGWACSPWPNDAGNCDIALARYNADGSLDSTFGSGGLVTTDFAGSDGATGVAVQVDGRIVAVGGTGTGDFALARYNSDGSLDASFGAGGKVTTDFTGDSALDVALQADGKIVAAGFAFDGASSVFALARYSADGSLDASFGTGGKVTTDFGGSEVGRAVAIQADGKIVAAGETCSVCTGFDNKFALARYLAQVPFAAFNAKVEIDDDDEFEVKATFMLGAGSDGINVPTEIVSLQLSGGGGSFSITIPAGSFTQDKKGRFKFEGVIDGVPLEAVIRPLVGAGFEFKAEGQGTDLTGIANPVTVTLTVGDDGGSTTVEAEFE